MTSTTFFKKKTQVKTFKIRIPLFSFIYKLALFQWDCLEMQKVTIGE